MNLFLFNSILSITLLLPLTGCGKKGPPRVVVTGTVSYAGTPVKNGEIRFYPTGDTSGPVSGAPIVDGQYKVKAKGGVPIGDHIVRITAFRVDEVREVPEEMKDVMEGGARIQYLPAQYNSDSTLKCSVDKESGVQNFDLESIE